MLLLLDYDRLSFIDIESLGGGFSVETTAVDGEPLTVAGGLLQILDTVGLMPKLSVKELTAAPAIVEQQPFLHTR